MIILIWGVIIFVGLIGYAFGYSDGYDKAQMNALSIKRRMEGRG